MSITITVMKEGDNCQFFADEFPDNPKTKTAKTGQPITYCVRPLFGTYVGPPMLSLPLEQAKKMAEEILKL